MILARNPVTLPAGCVVRRCGPRSRLERQLSGCLRACGGGHGLPVRRAPDRRQARRDGGAGRSARKGRRSAATNRAADGARRRHGRFGRALQVGLPHQMHLSKGEQVARQHSRRGELACDLAEIVEIRLDAVVVKNQLTNRLELLPLPAPPLRADARTQAAAPVPEPEVVRASPEFVSVEVPKASVDHYLLNLTDLLSSAQATPRFKNCPGRPAGHRGVRAHAYQGGQRGREGGTEERRRSSSK